MIVEPSKKFLAEKGVMVAKSVTQFEGKQLSVRVCNPLSEPVTVYKGTNLGMISSVATLRAIPTQPQRVNRITVADPQVPEYLEDLYNRSVSGLDAKYHDSVANLLCKNADVFAQNDKDLGKTSVAQHDIKTEDETPIKQPPRRFPPEQEKEIEKQINDLLDSGLIKPGNGPWGSPLVLVKKKDGSVRMCVDYRKLNSKTVKDAYPLPRIDDTLDSLANARYFSTLDLASGYHQVANTPQAKVKSAMITKQGLFEWEVMSFGLTGAPATFQRTMEHIMRGLNYEILWIYLDDVILLGHDVDQMIERLQLVFDRFRSANLKLKPKKCHLFKTELEFLGHIVSAKGISTDPKKTERVREWSIPKNVSEVRSFLGLAGYYRRFVPNYYDIAKPLHDLTQVPRKKQRGVKFKWTKEANDAFIALKEALTSTPILGYPRDEGKYILDTDASEFAMGAVLSQVQDGQEVVIAYSSKALSHEQRKYCVTRKEFLAVVYHLKYFRNYLWGRDIQVRTDHGALRWYKNFKQPDYQLSSWIETVEEFGVEITTRPGIKHSNADALSRIPSCAGKKCVCAECVERSSKFVDVATNTGTDTVSSVTEVQPVFVSSISIDSELTASEISEEQKSDPGLSKIFQMKLEGKPQPSYQDISQLGSEMKCYWAEWDRVVLKNGILYRKWEHPNASEVWWQIILPRKFRSPQSFCPQSMKNRVI